MNQGYPSGCTSRGAGDRAARGTQRIDVTIDLTRRDHVDAAIAELQKMAAAEPRVLTRS